MRKRQVIRRWKVGKFKKNKDGFSWRYLMKCVICGKNFEITGSIFDRNEGYVCNRKCADRLQSQQRKGKPTWIKGKTKDDYPQLKGYWLGKKFSKKHKDNLSESHKGQVPWMKGRKMSDEHKGKIGEALKGEKNPNWGKHLSEETKSKIGEANEGENCNFWQGGKSFEPYTPEFTERLKDKIRKRDSYICQKCGKSQEEELHTQGCKLTIHHIDYDKKNCNETNLISLCISCHSVTNINREYWENYFTEKLIHLYKTVGRGDFHWKVAPVKGNNNLIEKIYENSKMSILS